MSVYEGDLRGVHAEDASHMLDDVTNLSLFLAVWMQRQEGDPDAQARLAANGAMILIDRGLATLHSLRQRLVSEMRAYDDATAARVDALLAARRGGAE